MPNSRTARRIRLVHLPEFVVAVMVGCLLATVPASAAVTGSMTGVVTLQGGGPLEGVEVDVYLLDGAGNPSGPVRGGITNANGAYEVLNLAPGNHVVLFGYANVTNPIAKEEFYNDAPDLASADPVPVGDGTVTGIDAVLSPTSPPPPPPDLHPGRRDAEEDDLQGTEAQVHGGGGKQSAHRRAQRNRCAGQMEAEGRQQDPWRRFPRAGTKPTSSSPSCP